MNLAAGKLGRVAASGAASQRQVVQGLPVRAPVTQQRNVTCNVATGPRPIAGGAPKPVQINMLDEGFDGERAWCSSSGAGWTGAADHNTWLCVGVPAVLSSWQLLFLSTISTSGGQGTYRMRPKHPPAASLFWGCAAP